MTDKRDKATLYLLSVQIGEIMIQRNYVRIPKPDDNCKKQVIPSLDAQIHIWASLQMQNEMHKTIKH